MAELRWRRVASGSYESADGRFSIYRDPSVAASMFGALSEPWELLDTLQGQGLSRSYATLRDAKRAAQRRIDKEAENRQRGS